MHPYTCPAASVHFSVGQIQSSTYFPPGASAIVKSNIPGRAQRAGHSVAEVLDHLSCLSQLTEARLKNADCGNGGCFRS
jgi:hypothetical protein